MTQPNFVQLRDGLTTTTREIMRFQNMPAANNAASTGELLAANQQIVGRIHCHVLVPVNSL